MTLLTFNKHRLVCGDVLDGASIATALYGQLADLCITDPPYGCGGDDGMAERARKAGMRMGKKTCVMEEWDRFEDNGGEADYATRLALWLSAILPHRKPLAPVIVWGWSGSIEAMLRCGREAGLTLVTIYTWAKPSASPRFVKNCVLTKSTEFAAVFRGDTLPPVYGSLLRDHWVQTKSPSEARLTEHPTQKPVELYRRLIDRLCPPGGIVLDPMCGSGTTLWACEALGDRTACMVERDPRWCEEIRARWGSTPEHARPGDQLRLTT